MVNVMCTNEATTKQQDCRYINPLLGLFYLGPNVQFGKLVHDSRY